MERPHSLDLPWGKTARAARADLRNLFSAHHGFRIEWTHAVALFPHTDHIENDRAASTEALLRSKRRDRIDTAGATRRQVARDSRHGEHTAGNDGPRW